ncbi:MAG: glycoside hydrolase family protein [Gallintestinimicrobium sp.]
MFASRWPKDLGFGANWLFNCEIVRASSKNPEGPYTFQEVVLGRRGRTFFDGMNVHNPYIRKWNQTYYLYYMGTTFGGPIPGPGDEVDSSRFTEVWNRKRIGLATAPSVFGPWTRCDEPLISPRDCSHWDCTATTNPAVAIQPDGTTYMLYKSRSFADGPLKIGVAKAPRPDGPFERILDDPIFNFEDPNIHLEDPYLWYEDGKFRLLIKDDFKTEGPASAASGVQVCTLKAPTAFTGNSPKIPSFTPATLPGPMADRPIRQTANALTFCLMKITIPRICFWQPGKVLHPTSFPEPGTW